MQMLHIRSCGSHLRPVVMRLDDHPTVVKVRRDPAPPPPQSQLEAQWLRQVVLDAGADDTGLVEIAFPELADERPYVEAIFPSARALISFVSRMNRVPVRSPARSLANRRCSLILDVAFRLRPT